MNCEAELCLRWTGSGCICAVLDLEPQVERWSDGIDDYDEDDEEELDDDN